MIFIPAATHTGSFPGSIKLRSHPFPRLSFLGAKPPAESDFLARPDPKMEIYVGSVSRG